MKLVKLSLFFFFFVFINSQLLNAQNDKWRLIYKSRSIRDIGIGGNGALYACGDFGIAKSDKRDTLWRLLSNNLGFYTFNYFSVSSSGTIYVIPSPYNIILKSANEGKSWDTVFKGNNLMSIACDKEGTIWTGNFSNELYYSTNQGKDWGRIDRKFGAGLKLIRTNIKNDLFVGTYKALFIKEEKDTTWSKIFEGDLISFEVAGNDTIFVSSYTYGLSISTDKGKSWKNKIADYYTPTLAWGSKSYLWGANSLAGGYGVLLSTDLGANWSYTGCPYEAVKIFTFGDDVFFACSEGIFIYDDSIVPFRGKNYVPLAKGNRWQRYQLTNYPGFKTHIEIDTLSVDADTIINGNKYYLLKGYSFRSPASKLVRYDSVTNSLLALYNNSDKMLLNYNLFNREKFIMLDFNQGINLEVEFNSGEKNVFGATQKYGGFFYSMLPFRSATYNELYYDGIGFGMIDSEYDPSGLPEVFSYYRIICAIVNNGDSSKSFRKPSAPEISYKPIDTLKNYMFALNVAVDHEFSYRNPVYSEVDNTFIDSVYLEGYYKKNDIKIPVGKVPGVYVDSAVNFRVEYKLDETLLNSGYKFYYKITAKDKGLIPYYRSWPETDYFFVDINNVVGIKNETGKGDFTFNLYQNYPNPFNPVTYIKFSLRNESQVELALFNILGQKLKILFYGVKKAGEHEIKYDFTEMSSGIYFYQLKAGSFVQTRKLILQK